MRARPPRVVALLSGYLIADRRPFTVQALREKYPEEGKTAFLFTLRVGGDVFRPLAFAKHLL